MDNFIRLDITVDEEDCDRILALLAEKVSFGWEEESAATGETRYRIYCEHRPLIEDLCEQVKRLAPSAVLELQTVPGRDWTAAWREFFTPVFCGRFVVLPPWLQDMPVENAHPVLIEPKSAFGTGHHATTALCLKAVSLLLDEGRIDRGMRFFDLGTGSGVLGIACALAGLTGRGADIDPPAVENAKENAALNHVRQSFCPVPGSIEVAGNESYDLILANILAGPLREMAPEVLKLLRPGGCLVLSGILDIQAEAVEAAYSTAGPARKLHEGEWVALLFETPHAR